MKTFYQKSTGVGSIGGVQEVAVAEHLLDKIPKDMFLKETSAEVKAYLKAKAAKG